jgi:hypothetical protein
VPDFDRMTDEEIEDQFPHGRCDLCESALSFSDDEGEFCQVCEPRVALEYSPVRASFHVDPPTRGIPGRVTWAAWYAP